MDLLQSNQSLLVRFANNPFGRKQLCIDKKYDNNKIVKVTSNSYHVQVGNKIVGEFRTYPLYKNILESALTDIEILKTDKLYKHLTQHKKDIQSLYHYLNPIGEKYIYPTIYHDIKTVYAGAGDGHVMNSGAVWATIRGASTGTVSVSGVTAYLTYSGDNVDDYAIYRGFLPFDTSSLGAGAKITAATLSFWPTVVVDGASGSIVLIQTTQASGTTLATGDYDNITLNTPTEGATRKLNSALTTGQYNTIDLNASGLTWIVPTGYTLLGGREKRDVDNSAPVSATVNRVLISTSREASTTQDPKIAITYISTSGFFVFF